MQWHEVRLYGPRRHTVHVCNTPNGAYVKAVHRDMDDRGNDVTSVDVDHVDNKNGITAVHRKTYPEDVSHSSAVHAEADAAVDRHMATKKSFRRFNLRKAGIV